MALPVVKNATDCASFSHTVLPYVPQLLTLPSRLADAAREQQPAGAFMEIYVSTNPVVTAFAFALFLAPVFLVVSEVTRNYSQVDRLWSILPSVYNFHYSMWARLNGVSPTTADTILRCTLIWGARLTYNYYRKGGYSFDSEDYRWAVLRSKINNRFLFFLFNITFISLTQSLLLFAITTPTYIFLLLSTVPGGDVFGIPYLAFSRGLIFFVIIETAADHQQWNFQAAKRLFEKEARIPDDYKDWFALDDLDRGFVVSGLWSLCRHPNFAAEQAFWLTLYLWSCYNTHYYVNWTGIGVLGYVILFQASTRFTESITAAKYSEYKDYVARVGMFIPRLSLKPRGMPAKSAKERENKDTEEESTTKKKDTKKKNTEKKNK